MLITLYITVFQSDNLLPLGPGPAQSPSQMTRGSEEKNIGKSCNVAALLHWHFCQSYLSICGATYLCRHATSTAVHQEKFLALDLRKQSKDLLDRPDIVLSNFFEVPVLASSPAACCVVFFGVSEIMSIATQGCISRLCLLGYACQTSHAEGAPLY